MLLLYVYCTHWQSKIALFQCFALDSTSDPEDNEDIDLNGMVLHSGSDMSSDQGETQIVPSASDGDIVLYWLYSLGHILSLHWPRERRSGATCIHMQALTPNPYLRENQRHIMHSTSTAFRFS